MEENKKEEFKSIVILGKIEDFFLNILDKIKLKFLANLYRGHREVWRYLIFGVLTTIVNIITYSVCFYNLKISNATSNIIAWILSAFFAYITNKFFVFVSKQENFKNLIKEICSFFSCRLLTLFIDEAIMIITVDKLGFSGVLMKIIANAIVIILNYIFSKILIFKKKEK